MNVTEAVESQITAYAERHGLTPDQAAERLITHGLTAVAGWRLSHHEGGKYPYQIEQTTIGANEAGESVMAPGWTLWRATATLDEAREELAVQLDDEVQRQQVAGLALMQPIKGSWRQRTVWRIAKTN